MSLHIQTPRLSLRPFAMGDAEELFACITPGMTRFMSWDPPAWEDYVARCEALVGDGGRTEVQFVVRRTDTTECLGVTAVERPAADLPELGVWLKAAAHGQGYGFEAVEATVRWASATLGSKGFVYPVATQNIPSRKIVERLGGAVVATRPGRKYDAVVYRVPPRAT